MKKPVYSFAFAALLILLSCGEAKNEQPREAAIADSTAKAVVPEALADVTGPDSATQAKAWQMFMTPGAMHKWMASFEGKWDAVMVSYQGPDAPPTPESKLKVTCKMIYNGLYQETVYDGEVMGMKFEGKATLAYDNARKKFINTWIDNMGSGLLVMEGDWDEAAKTLRVVGQSTDPVSGNQMKFTQLTKVIDDKHQQIEMYGSLRPGGGEFKMIQIKLEKR
jgi:hypothetical protein